MNIRTTSKKSLVIAFVFSLIASTLSLNLNAAPAAAQTLGDPFSCEGEFHFLAKVDDAAGNRPDNSTLYTVDATTNPFALVPIADTCLLYTSPSPRDRG